MGGSEFIRLECWDLVCRSRDSFVPSGGKGADADVTVHDRYLTALPNVSCPGIANLATSASPLTDAVYFVDAA